MILVTGATGRVGYHLMEALADTHADVAAMVRVEARAADLPGTPRHVVATFDDPPPAEVLRGFDRVFLLSPAIEEQAELETVFIDALLAASPPPGRAYPVSVRSRDVALFAACAAELADVGTGTGSGLHSRSGPLPAWRAGSCPSAR